MRKGCHCIPSRDIGAYDTCPNGCKYCYANYSEESVAKSCSQYNLESPILCGTLDEKDKITERKVKSLKEQDSKQYLYAVIPPAVELIKETPYSGY